MLRRRGVHAIGDYKITMSAPRQAGIERGQRDQSPAGECSANSQRTDPAIRELDYAKTDFALLDDACNHRSTQRVRRRGWRWFWGFRLCGDGRERVSRGNRCRDRNRGWRHGHSRLRDPRGQSGWGQFHTPGHKQLDRRRQRKHRHQQEWQTRGTTARRQGERQWRYQV